MLRHSPNSHLSLTSSQVLNILAFVTCARPGTRNSSKNLRCARELKRPEEKESPRPPGTLATGDCTVSVVWILGERMRGSAFAGKIQPGIAWPLALHPVLA